MRQSWFQLGDRNNKLFQTMTNIRKRQILFEERRILRVTGLTLIEFLPTYYQIVPKEFKEAARTNPVHAIPLCREITEAGNELLIM